MNLRHRIVSNSGDLNLFIDAIKIAGLPHQDLNAKDQILIIYFINDALVGTGGLELINQYGLLRSISVNPNYRNKGIGRKITNNILDTARLSNLDEVYLLTETAKDYFQKLGLKEVNRDSVPEPIKSTTEFASVCPASATCMVMKLKTK